ncbi:NAD(P)-binding domain protein [Metarhizium album ARSEF 1941]|uniref:Hydroxynaphthalene reductase-like protein Arp2 n=1 Tax=Metarhizium album (strain ARSEF 1941) TaxID=1081103 RepID=A0A0B2WM43_METAS|nr:NAD(P)-binding domain protein [Metarhizium album ARSEF 1941]KHN94562.1 NAD(P)-binding domain protein [Metarhizium album ARSEF 1941]
MSLAGKAFIVTGGASGIGRSAVRKLLGLAAEVHVVDAASDVATHEGLAGRQRNHANVDVASRAQVRNVLDRIAAQSDAPLGGLVHCAAILRPTEASEAGDDQLRRLWDVNVVGTWNVNTELYRLVRAARGSGSGSGSGSGARPSVDALASIVNMASMASLRGIPDVPGYVATKHAVLGLSRSFAQSWASVGLRVNCVAPGAVNTPMIRGMVIDAGSPYKGVLRHVLEPDEVADTIVFLLGEGSSAITGQVVEVNGGWP